MSDIPKLGKTSTEFDVDTGHRDAFHVACVLVTAPNDVVKAGDEVRFCDNDLDSVEPIVDGEDHCAIVDPFLNGRVMPGIVFWVFLLPGISKNMSHTFDIDVDIDYQDPPEPDGCRACDS